MKEDNIYSFSVPLNDGTTLSLSALKGKVILIVNTALHSPFTSFYPFLQSLYRRFQDSGFEILDIPSNQFKEQSPESDEEIKEITEHDYETTFLRAKKSSVRGDDMLPLYGYLTKKKKFAGFDSSSLLAPVLAAKEIKRDANWLKDSNIKENFTFFFIDRNGKVRKRFEATADKNRIEKYLANLLIEPLSDC